jgi:hypothetical protein
MSEIFDGVEGDWVEVAEPSADEHWNEGWWRAEDRPSYYKDGVWSIPDNVTGSSVVWSRFVPAEVLPTEPGLYRDVDDDLWYLPNYGEWQLSAGGEPFGTDTSTSPKNYLPFTKIG